MLLFPFFLVYSVVVATCVNRISEVPYLHSILVFTKRWCAAAEDAMRCPKTEYIHRHQRMPALKIGSQAAGEMEQLYAEQI